MEIARLTKAGYLASFFVGPWRSFARIHSYQVIVGDPDIFLITLLIFLAMNVLPGDPLVAMFGFEGFAKLSPHDRQRIMEQLGLADPLWMQYAHWMQDIITGNLGESFLQG